jgi:hypothetical protein
LPACSPASSSCQRHYLLVYSGTPGDLFFF